MHARKKYSNDEIIDRYFHAELQKEEQAQLFYKMNTDESLRERLGAAALEGAERFSSRTMALRYSEIYLKEI